MFFAFRIIRFTIAWYSRQDRKEFFSTQIPAGEKKRCNQHTMIYIYFFESHTNRGTAILHFVSNNYIKFVVSL